MTGSIKEIWSDLWHEPLFSEKNQLIVANLQNGHFQVYDLKTKLMTDMHKSSTESMFFDKSEENIISVSNNWSGIITISKFSVRNSEPAKKLYELHVDKKDSAGFIQFDPTTNKLFLPLRNNGAYFLDVK